MNTIPKLLMRQAQTRADQTAIRTKQLGIWQVLTWQQVLVEVRMIACGLADLGVGKGDVVAVIGNSMTPIFNSITACQVVGAIPMPVYGNSVGDELAHMLDTSNARIAIVQDQQQVDALFDLPEQGRALQQIIYISKRGLSFYSATNMSSFDELKERGQRFHIEKPEFFNAAIDDSNQDTTGMVLFTSGIKGKPSAVQLTYKSMLNVAAYIAKVEDITDADEVLSFMPISRATNLLFGYVMSHVTGLSVNCPESTETIMENLREVNPTILYGPPQVYKHIAASIYERIDVTTGLSRKLYDYYINGAMEKREHLRGMGEVLISGPVRDLYGLGRVRLAFVGSDMIASQLSDFFQVLGIQICQIYGNTESFGCISIQTKKEAAENVGQAIEGMEVKISDAGEILCRSENLATGYLNDSPASQKAFDRDGWHHTGDVGMLEPNGLLHIYDQLDAVAVTAEGVTYMPKIIETGIKVSPYVREAFVTGGEAGELIATIMLNDELTRKWAEGHKIRYTEYADLTRKEEVEGLIAEAIAQANKATAQQNQPPIHKFIIFHRQLSFIVGELTLMSRLRRPFLQKSLIEVIKAAQSGQKNVQFFDSVIKEKVTFNICHS